MNLSQRALALETMLNTPGWQVLNDYLTKNSVPVMISIDGLDSLIKQAYKNGVSQGHKDVLNFINTTVECARRNKKELI